MGKELTPVESPKQPEMLKSKRAGRAWQLLAHIFPGAFINQLGEKPPTMWRRAIDGMSDNQLKRALDAMAKTPREYRGRVPTLPEFWNAGQAPQHYLGVPETDEQEQKRLGIVRASPEFAAKYLEKMRKALRS